MDKIELTLAGGALTTAILWFATLDPRFEALTAIVAACLVLYTGSGILKKYPRWDIYPL